MRSRSDPKLDRWLIGEMAFPEYKHQVAHLAQGGLRAPIPGDIRRFLGIPEDLMGAGHASAAAACVGVPETTMNEDCELTARYDEVGSTG